MVEKIKKLMGLGFPCLLLNDFQASSCPLVKNELLKGSASVFLIYAMVGRLSDGTSVILDICHIEV